MSAGLAASLRALASSVIAIVHTRLELFSTEVQEERLRLVRILFYGMAAFFFLATGAVMLALLLTILLWDSNRLLALALSATAFLAVGAIALAVALREQRRGSQLLAGSLAELAQDRAALDRDA